MSPKRKKDLLMTGSAVLAIIVAVLGWQWSDSANTPFWWNFWNVAAVVCLVAFVGGWIYVSTRYKAPKK